MDRGRSGRIDGYHDSSRHQESHRIHASSGHSPVNKRDRSPRYSSHHNRHHSKSYHTTGSQRHRDSDYGSQSSKHHQSQHADSTNRSSSSYGTHSSDTVISHGKKTVRSKGDWSEHISSSGRRYYYNCKTEVSKWEKPKEWIDDDTKFSRASSDLEKRKDISGHQLAGVNHATSKNGCTDPQSSSNSKFTNADDYHGRKTYSSSQSTPEYKRSTLHELVSPEEDDDGFSTEASIQNKEDYDTKGSVHMQRSSRMSRELMDNSAINSSPTENNSIMKDLSQPKLNSNLWLKTDTINFPAYPGTQQYKAIIASLEVDIPAINHSTQSLLATVNEESKHARNSNPESGIYYKQAEHIANDMLSRLCNDAIKSKFEILHAKTSLSIARYKVECHDLRLQILLRSHSQEESVTIESSKV